MSIGPFSSVKKKSNTFMSYMHAMKYMDINYHDDLGEPVDYNPFFF